MSHARTNQTTGTSSSLVSDRGLIWTYTANAVTVSKKRSVCEPVGMAKCVQPEAATLRKTGICALAMSHARTNQTTGTSSSLVSDRGLIWTYTANAVTVSKKRSVCEPVGMAKCVQPEAATLRKTGIVYDRRNCYNKQQYGTGARSIRRPVRTCYC